jgi:hypothetical protein
MSVRFALTDAEQKALQAFAAKHGRTWKSELITVWMTRMGARAVPHAEALYGLRRVLGETGLERIEVGSGGAVRFSLTETEQSAIQVFAAKYGRDWKSELVTVWRTRMGLRGFSYMEALYRFQHVLGEAGLERVEVDLGRGVRKVAPLQEVQHVPARTGKTSTTPTASSPTRPSAAFRSKRTR